MKIDGLPVNLKLAGFLIFRIMALNEIQLELFTNLSYLLSYRAHRDILSLRNQDSSHSFGMTNMLFKISPLILV